MVITYGEHAYLDCPRRERNMFLRVRNVTEYAQRIFKGKHQGLRCCERLSGISELKLGFN